MKILTKRQKKLLQLMISDEDYKTIDFYSQRMEVSERTLHNDLKSVEGYLKERSVILHKKPGVGIKVQAQQDTKLSLLHGLDLKREDADPLSTKIRKMKIISQLLYSKQATSLQKLSDEFMVSKTSIVKDLDKIEEWLSDYDLKLVKNREGTTIKGSEGNIRKAIAGVISDLLNLNLTKEYELNTKSRMDSATFSGLSNLFQDVEVKQVENIIEDAEKQLQYKISDTYYINLVTHILILIKRIRSNNSLFLQNLHFQDKRLHALETYSVAKQIADSLSNHFEIEVPESEISYINQYLMCSGIESEMSSTNIELFINNLDENLKSLVDEMLNISTRVMNIDLNNDKELYLGLLMHIKPMINRLKYSIDIKNPLLEDIKTQHSATFGMTWLVCSVIEQRLGVKVSEDEIGYVTLHFQAAIERCVSSKKVIVVCPGGIGTSQLIANRIRRFIPQIEVVDVVSLSKLNSMRLSDVDFIISTVPLKLDLKPVIIISSLVNQTDIKNINNFFAEYLFTKENVMIQCTNLLKVLDKELIFTNLDYTNKTDAIEFLCSQLQVRGYVNKCFKDSVINRENIAPTSLGNRVAIPHGEDKSVNNSKVVIATFKNEVNWGKGNIKIVFLIALKFGENLIVKDVLTDLYNIFDSELLLNNLMRCKTAKEVIKLLEEGNSGD